MIEQDGKERLAFAARRRLNGLLHGVETSDRLGPPRVQREYSEEELDALLLQLLHRALALLGREDRERLAA